VGVHRTRCVDARRDPCRPRSAVAWRHPDEVVGDEHCVVATEREIHDATRRVEDGLVAAGERTGGDHDMALITCRVGSDEVQFARDRIVLGMWADHSTATCQIHTAHGSSGRVQLVRGVVAERQDQAAECDQAIDDRLGAEATSAVRHTAVAYQDRVDHALAVDP
jgi:hypothetical protein